MKNFIDRFAYVCHHPLFFKNTMVLTSSGINYGLRLMLMSFSIAPRVWGFKIVHSLGVVTNEHPDFDTPVEKTNEKVNDAAKKFYDALVAGRPKPSIFSMASFLSVKPSLKKVGPEYFDYHYWKDHDWFENDAYYYYDPEANFVRKALAKIFNVVKKHDS